MPTSPQVQPFVSIGCARPFSSTHHVFKLAAHRNPSSWHGSVGSYASVANSQTGSTRNLLSDMANGSSSDYGLLNPPAAPFASVGSRNSRDNLSVTSGTQSNLSLSVNYLPSKFTPGLSSPSGANPTIRNRKGDKDGGINVPKRGGGLEAFKAGESRLPRGRQRLRWNKFKWILFLANMLLTIYSIGGLVVCLLTWFGVWKHADIIRIGNRTELILSTVAGSIGVFTAVVGWAGILLNDRSFLAWYTFLTWITFAALVTPGYVTFRKRSLNLEGKVNAQWSRDLGAAGRLTIQDQLKCCGYFSPFVEATITQTCYARSVLPGCKLPYLQFQRFILKWWFTVVFLLVPAQLAVMIAALLCSNHVTYRFGKGMMPEAYRLNASTMAVIMENYANQLAEQYDADVAKEIMRRTRSRLNASLADNLSNSATYGGSENDFQHAAMPPFHAKYQSLEGRPAVDRD